MSKHLSLSDRTLIERYITLDYSFAYIADKLHRSQTTISREVKKYRAFAEPPFPPRVDCVKFNACVRKSLCNSEAQDSCFQLCKFCKDFDCTKLCIQYESRHCPDLDRAPFVCTKCPREKQCKRTHAYYSAFRANALSLSTLRKSRLGPRATPEQLKKINDLVAPLLKKGQSLNHILSNHADEIQFTERTIYNYIDQHALSIKNIDLPKKVRYKVRHQQKVRTAFEYNFRKGHSLDDFKAFIEQHPGISIVEMDTVKGCRKSGKVLLTFIFRENNSMLIFLMNDGTQESVNAVFDTLTEKLGLDLFRKLFPVILTDNGVEFKGVHRLEFTDKEQRRTHIFYCDPQAS